MTAHLQDATMQRQQDSQALDASLSRIEFLGSMASTQRALAVRTADSLWVDAYERTARQLQTEMAIGRDLAPTVSSLRGLIRTDSINQIIIANERHAISVALAGDRDSARQILESPQFGYLIGAYGDALLEYARVTDDGGHLLNVRMILQAIEEESWTIRAALLHGRFDEHAGGYTDDLRNRLASAASYAAPHVGPQATVDALTAFDQFVRAPAAPEAVEEAHAALTNHLVLLQNGVSERITRIERHAARRAWMVGALYLLLAVMMLGGWYTIVRLIRTSLAERDDVERRLRESDARNAALLAAVPDMIFILDRNGRYLDFHCGDDTHLFETPQNFLGRTVEEIMPESFAILFRNASRRVLESGRPSYFEYDLEVNGRRQWFEAWIAPEEPDHVLVVARDITERREAAVMIREGEARFRSLVENSLVGTYIVREDVFAYVNPRFAEIFGRSPRELIGCAVGDVMDPSETLTSLVESDEQEASVHATLYGRHSAGHPITVEVFGSAMEIDSRPAVIGTLLDVTERERTREQIAVLKAFYEETLNRLPVYVAVMDRELRCRYLNPAAIDDDALRIRAIGKPIEFLAQVSGLDAGHASRWRAWLEEVIETGETSQMEEEFVDSNDERRCLLRVAAGVRDEYGSIQQVVTYALDISERKAYEAILLDAKVRAEEVARLKSSFLANMSHEIRTPLTGILGFASMLEDEVSEEQRPFATLILRSGKRLLDTLNAVLDLSRLEAGELKLDVRPTDVTAETEEIASYLRSLSSEKGLELRVEAAERPVYCLIDASAFHIVLNNLIGNAIKFTPEGRVNVRIGRDERFGVLEVSDTGIGIDEAFLPQLFDEFKQESESLSRSHEGAGLGLAITRKLIELMNGRISVRTTKGEGTTFTVTLPLGPEQLGLELEDAAAPAVDNQ